MSTDFAPVFEKKFHTKVIPGLLHLMDDQVTREGRGHRARGGVGMLEDSTVHLLKKMTTMHFNRILRMSSTPR